MAKTKVVNSPPGEHEIGPDVLVSWAETNVVLSGEYLEEPDGMVTVNYFFDEDGNDISQDVATAIAQFLSEKF